MAQGKITISSIAKLQGWLWDVAVTGFGARRQTNLVHYYISAGQGKATARRCSWWHRPLCADPLRGRLRRNG